MRGRLETGMDLTLLQSSTLLASALLIGTLMGATSIGGVLLVPLIALICDLPASHAIPVGMLAALCSGLAASCVFARHGNVDGRTAATSLVPAGLGAITGAVCLPFVPAGIISLGLITVCAIGFFSSLRVHFVGHARQKAISTPAFAALLGLVGLGSSLSGTSGPVLLVPPLLWLGGHPRDIAGQAQVIQLPVAACASIGFAMQGAIDVPLAAMLVPPVVAGVILGARLAQHLSTARLSPLMSLVLAIAGLMTALK